MPLLPIERQPSPRRSKEFDAPSVDHQQLTRHPGTRTATQTAYARSLSLPGLVGCFLERCTRWDFSGFPLRQGHSSAELIRTTELIFSHQSDGILLCTTIIRKLTYCGPFGRMLECKPAK